MSANEFSARKNSSFSEQTEPKKREMKKIQKKKASEATQENGGPKMEK